MLFLSEAGKQALANPTVPLVQLLELGFSPVPVRLNSSNWDLLVGRRVNLLPWTTALNTGWTGSLVASYAPEYYKGYQFTEIAKTTTTTSEGRTQHIQATVAGETFTAYCVFLAGTSDRVSFGLYDTTTPSWGVDADVQAEIVFGPGAISTYIGSLQTISGLSTTEPTGVRITRVTTAVAGNIWFYMYPGTPASTTIGDSIKYVCPQVEAGPDWASPFIPTSGAIVNEPGVLYRGAYGMGGLSAVDDSPGEIKGMEMELFGGSADIIALALDEAKDWQGTPVTVKTAILDELYRVTDAPVSWSGLGDTMSVQETEESTAVHATAESTAVDLLRGSALLYNNESQQMLFPGDRGLEYIVAQSDEPIVWPSREFFFK